MRILLEPDFTEDDLDKMESGRCHVGLQRSVIFGRLLSLGAGNEAWLLNLGG